MIPLELDSRRRRAMTSAADIAAQAADAILSRVEQTHPRALHRDMLIEEITRAIEQMKMTEPRGNNPRAAEVIEGRVRGAWRTCSPSIVLALSC
jgi:hypothetical protein